MEKILQGFLVALVGVVLSPVVYSLATSANVSGTMALVLGIIPVVFAVAVMVAVVKPMLKI
jgi:hypothetical protein